MDKQKTTNNGSSGPLRASQLPFSLMALLGVPLLAWALLVSTFGGQVQAACSTLSPRSGVQPSVASGYAYAVVATGLASPRSMELDSAGNLLVVQRGKGITSHVLNDGGGTCLSVKSSKTLISNGNLNHGLTLSPDGKTLYASDTDKVYAYPYNAQAGTVGSPTTLVYNMDGSDHNTRTLLIPKSATNYMVVGRGSLSNIDQTALVQSNAISQVKAFDLTKIPSGGYNYLNSGWMMGWGLRNEVGLGEAADGGIWGVENSADDLVRDGVNVHETNPAEELNWFGHLNGTLATRRQSNYGYPTCFTVWDPSTIPSAGSLKTGDQFALSSKTDCSNYLSPRIAFHPHTAPLDIKFNDSGNAAWVSFHGSWDSSDPVGYHVGYLDFKNNQPVAPSTSQTALNVVFANQDNSKCPNSCFRPAGLRFDKQGRLFVASDATGEIYVIQKTSSGSSAPSSSGTSTTSSASPTSTAAAKSIKARDKAVRAGFVALTLGMLHR